MSIVARPVVLVFRAYENPNGEEAYKNFEPFRAIVHVLIEGNEAFVYGLLGELKREDYEEFQESLKKYGVTKFRRVKNGESITTYL